MTNLQETTILFIENDDYLQALFTNEASSDNFKIIGASSKEDALLKFDQNSIDIVICGIDVLDHLNILRQFRDKSPDIPFFVTTPQNSIGLAVEAIKHGSNDFFLKPSDLFLVKNKIQNAMDVQNLKNSYIEVLQHKKQFEAYFDNANNVIFRIDLNDVVIGVNPRINNYFGIDPSEVINRPFNLVHDLIKNNFEDPEAYMEFISHHTYSRHKDGSLNVIEMVRSGLKLIKPKTRRVAILPREISNLEGEVLAKMWTYVDITELQKTTDLLRTVVEASPVPCIISRMDDGSVIFVNDPLAELIGVKTDELVGLVTPDFYADPAAREDIIRSIKADGVVRNREIQIKKINGDLIWMIINLTVTKLAGETVIISALYDISERKKIEDALRDSEERFRQLTENIGEIFWMTSPIDKKILYISGMFDVITGRSREKVYDDPNEFYKHVHEDDKTALEKSMRQPLTSERKVEYRYIRPGGEIRWLRENSYPIMDSDGKLYRMCGVIEDFTEQKNVIDDLEQTNIDLLETQGQLAQSEKMASLGMLVAGIAHEINTPIGAIGSMHNTLMRATEKLSDLVDCVCDEQKTRDDKFDSFFDIIHKANHVIESGTERITTIVRRLRAFARLDEAEVKEIDIHEGLEDTLTLINHEIKFDITINRNYGKIRPISCYPGRLNQVFLNLIINAKQAIKDKGEITITTYEHDDKVFLEFKDNGAGISKEHLDKIFDPGFTTKGVGVGTGLGLSICYKIIEDHHGTIKATSKLGEGTTFTIILPTNLDKILNEAKQ